MAQIEKAPLVSVRSTCPGSYMFKIQSFSLLSEFLQKSNDVECFKSPEFESNGHKWKLAVYPDGNKKLGVEDHISVYLVAEDADIDSVESGINVIFKMAVYDHFHDKFLTIQDNEVKRFHGLKKEWGFARLISIERYGNLVMIKQPSDGIFTWKVDSFSTLSEEVTKEFEVQGHEWKLQIYPNGKSSAEGTHLSMYLLLSGSNKSYISCVLRVRDQVNGKHHEGAITRHLGETSFRWGYRKFILLSDLKDKSRGFILNDSLIAEVEVKLISKDASC